jgi:hypothetical protein
MRKQLVALSLLLIAGLAVSCSNPASAAKNSSTKGSVGTVKVAFKDGSKAIGTRASSNLRAVKRGSRAIVADWDTTIKSYAVTLHCTSVSTADMTATASVADGSVTFSSVATGTWNVSATALNIEGVTVGAGSASGQEISSEGTTDIPISISQTQTGTGNFSFTFRFPQSSANYVAARLYDTGNTAVGDLIVPTLTNISTTLFEATVAESGVASGNYRLQLSFSRDGVPVGIYGEGVNVWDNVTSDQWLNPSGTYLSMRTFSESDFASGDASLADLGVMVDGEATVIPTAFDSSTTEYSIYASEGTSITFVPVESVSGQKVQYQVNGGGYSTLYTGEFTNPVQSGDTVDFLVTAPDHQTTKIYTVAILRSAATYIYFAPGIYTNLDFTAESTEVTEGNTVQISSATGGSNWQWFVNGTKQEETTSTYSFSSEVPGFFTICVTVTVDGVVYSGSVNVTVNPNQP